MIEIPLLFLGILICLIVYSFLSYLRATMRWCRCSFCGGYREGLIAKAHSCHCGNSEDF